MNSNMTEIFVGGGLIALAIGVLVFSVYHAGKADAKAKAKKEELENWIKRDEYEDHLKAESRRLADQAIANGSVDHVAPVNPDSLPDAARARLLKRQ